MRIAKCSSTLFVGAASLHEISVIVREVSNAVHVVFEREGDS